MSPLFFFFGLEFLFWRIFFPFPKKNRKKWRHNFFFQEMQVVHMFMFFFVGGGGREICENVFFSTPWRNIFPKLIENVQVFQDEQRQLKNCCFQYGSRHCVILGRLHLWHFIGTPGTLAIMMFGKWLSFWNTLQGTNISPQNGILKMIFLLPR